MDGEVVALDDRRPARLRAAPGADLGAGRAGAPCRPGLPGVRPALPRRALAAGRAARGAQAAARARDPRRRPGSRYAGARRDRGDRVLRGGAGPGPRGDRGQAPPLPLRARPARFDLAQGQGPARAGARRGRLDAGGGDGQGARGARGGRVRGRSRCGSPARWARGSTAGPARTCGRASRPSRPTRPPFDPAPPPDYRGRWGGDLAGVRWVRPELVIRAELGGWSRDGHVRQAAYKGHGAAAGTRGRSCASAPSTRRGPTGRRGRRRAGASIAPVTPEPRAAASAARDVDPAWLVTGGRAGRAGAASRPTGTWHVGGPGAAS